MSNKLELYIIGAGDVGGFIVHHFEHFGEFELKGFLDEDCSKHDRLFYNTPVLGGLELLKNIDKEVAVAVAIANPIVKQKIVDKISQNSFIQFPPFIHSSVWLGNEVTVGCGCIIYPGVSINYEAIIKPFSTINMNVAIGHNCELGKFTTLSPGVNLGGFTRIRDASFVGIGASTLQGITIGTGVTIGGMTMVVKDVPDGATVVGNPGRIIKIK